VGRILAASDGSEGARHAVETAARVVAPLQLELWIVDATDGFSGGELSESPDYKGARWATCLALISDQTLVREREQALELRASVISFRALPGGASPASSDCPPVN
jgi:hypothetical protein